MYLVILLLVGRSFPRSTKSNSTLTYVDSDMVFKKTHKIKVTVSEIY